MLGELLIPEFDREVPITRRFLERVADERLSWKPHPKSWTMGQLGTHLSNLPTWAVETIRKSELDVAPGGKPSPQATAYPSRQEMLKAFDKNAAAAREAIASASDEDLMQPWSLLANGKALMTMPRLAVLRGFVMNHMVHHRAHLGVYLRLCDIPVPAAYGPSGDEPGF